MQTPLRNLMAGLLLIHAVLGCSWRHAHACGSCEQASQSHAANCCSGHDPDHDHNGGHNGGQSEGQPARPCGCQWECHALCTYLPGQKTQVEATRRVMPLQCLALICPSNAERLSTTSCGACSHRCVASAPPLRMHLLHQILLI